MSTEIPVDQNDLDLEYVKNKRVSIIEALTKNRVPEDPKELGLLLIALSDMDRSSLSKKKIKVEKDIGVNSEHAMLMIAQMFNDPKMKTLGKTDSDENRLLPTLSMDILPPILVEGETDNSSGTETFDSFNKRVNNFTE